MNISSQQGCQCDACKKDGPHDSDCAVHNAPAYTKGECDCSVATGNPGDIAGNTSKSVQKRLKAQNDSADTRQNSSDGDRQESK